MKWLLLLIDVMTQKKMQRAVQAVRSHGNVLKYAVLQHISAPKPAMLPAVFSRFMSVSSARLEDSGFETATVSDVLKSKGKSADGSWLWCTTEDTVYDAVKSVCVHLMISHINFFLVNGYASNETYFLVPETFCRWRSTMWELWWLSNLEMTNQLLALSLREVTDKFLYSWHLTCGLRYGGKIQNHAPLPAFSISLSWHPRPNFFCS